MADITTVEGLRVLFDPAAVSAITNSDDAGAAGAVIYGLGPEGLEVAQSVAVLLQALQVPITSFAKLTRLDGSPVWVNGKSVGVARLPAPEEYPAAIHAVIFAGGFKQPVVESLDEARPAINNAGGKL